MLVPCNSLCYILLTSSKVHRSPRSRLMDASVRLFMPGEMSVFHTIAALIRESEIVSFFGVSVKNP